MTIEDLGDARFRPFENALEQALTEAIEHDGRVRGLFKLSTVPHGSIERVPAKSPFRHTHLDVTGAVSPTEFERWMWPVKFRESTLGVGGLGAELIENTLLAEDRALIDALDDSDPEEREGDWEDAVCRPKTSGGGADCTERVLMPCRALGSARSALLDRGVTIHYPDEVIREYASDKAHPGRKATKGYLLLEPEPDEVKLKMEMDWTLFRTTTSTTVALTMHSVWQTSIAAGSVIRLVD